MKTNRLKVAAILASLFTSSLFAQNLEASSMITKANNEKNLVEKGKNFVNLYYGVSLLNSFYKAVASASATELKVRGIGPVGLVYEHLVTDNIGIGGEFSYSTTKVTYREEAFTSIGGITPTYDYTWEFSTIRAMFRANFHFADSDKFDAYGLLSAGYRRNSFTFTSNDPLGDTNIKIPNFIPFGFKPGIGFRYFFTSNIGLNLEIAAGTPVLCGGLSFKF